MRAVYSTTASANAAAIDVDMGLIPGGGWFVEKIVRVSRDPGVVRVLLLPEELHASEDGCSCLFASHRREP